MRHKAELKISGHKTSPCFMNENMHIRIIATHARRVIIVVFVICIYRVKSILIKGFGNITELMSDTFDFKNANAICALSGSFRCMDACYAAYQQLRWSVCSVDFGSF